MNILRNLILKPSQQNLSTFFILDSLQFNNLLPFKPIKKLIYIYVYTSESIFSGTPIQLLFIFFVCLRVYKFTFIIAVPFSPKYVISILCIYGLFAAEGKQQGSDTLEAVNCRWPWRSCCSTCSDVQIKEVFFHFGSVILLFCT